MIQVQKEDEFFRDIKLNIFYKTHSGNVRLQIREASKKILMAVPLRPYPPPL